MNALLMVGAAQALFFSILIFNKKSKTNADLILGLWLITLAVYLAVFYVILLNPIEYYYLGIVDSLILPLISIWLFLYTKTVSAPSGKFKNSWLFHFFSIIAANTTLFPYYFSSKEKQLPVIQNIAELDRSLIIGIVTNFIVFTGYIVASYIELNKHKKRIHLNFSFENDIDLTWLKYLVYAITVIGILITLLLPFMITNRIHFFVVDKIVGVLLVVFIFFLGFRGFNQGNIFQSTSSGFIESNIEDDKEVDLLKGDQMADELHGYMIKNKPYLNSKLTLYDLSSALNWQTQDLSTHLNKFRNTNFYEFINYYRIEEVKKMLKKEHKTYTILAIAFECGFNSKASFNRIFKNATGLTPTQYINS